MCALYSLSANGEFPPVVTIRPPFRPTIKTTPPSTGSFSMTSPPTDYCKCKLDCGSSTESVSDAHMWISFHAEGEFSPSLTFSVLPFLLLSFSPFLTFAHISHSNTYACMDLWFTITLHVLSMAQCKRLQQCKCAPYWSVPWPHLSECCRDLLWH